MTLEEMLGGIENDNTCKHVVSLYEKARGYSTDQKSSAFLSQQYNLRMKTRDFNKV